MNYLAHFDQARLAIEKAATIDEVKSIRDKAEALRAYARQQHESLGMQNRCAEIKLRAERKLGKRIPEEFPHGGSRTEARSHRGILKNLGIKPNQSVRWQHVAAIPDEDFDAYVAETMAEERELTTAGALALAKSIKRAERLQKMGEQESSTCTVTDLALLSGRQFRCIYADPPWKYGNQGTRAATDNHYVTMTVDEIAALPVSELAAEDAHLHLWTTNAFLFDSRKIIESWGFTYKSCLVWVKPQMGIGNYWRVSHEFLLLGVRGKCQFQTRNQMSWISAPRTGHSRKPEQVRRAVEAVSPGPRIELFGRRPAEGWTVWGNEVSREQLWDVNVEAM